MPRAIDREKVWFRSAKDKCAAWHYRGTNGACVIMAAGFAVTKEAGTDKFARRFHQAGFSVLAFDYRRLGESTGEPRLVLPVRDQIVDWKAALSFAAELPEVDATRIALWGFSASGGHALRVAARNPAVAAVIAQTPSTDGVAAARNQARHQRPVTMLRFSGRGVLDALGGLTGRAPRLVPLAGKPGTLAVLTTPDAADADRALNPDNRYPDWRQAVAARSALSMAWYSPGRVASQVGCPLLVIVCDDDQSALAAPAIRVCERAPRGKLVRLRGGHYEPFLGGYAQAADAELAFLRHHLLTAAPPPAAAPLPFSAPARGFPAHRGG